MGLVLWTSLPGQAEFRLSDQESEVYYRFAVVAGQEVLVNGRSEVRGNVHSNGGIRLQPGATVDGNVSAVGRIQRTRATVTGTVQERAPELTLPVLEDAETLRALADQIFDDDLELVDGVVDEILFVDGEVRVRGSLNGEGTIIATGDIRFVGEEDDEGGDGEEDDGEEDDGEEEDDEEGDEEDDGSPAPMVLEERTRLSLLAFGDIQLDQGRALRGVLYSGQEVLLVQGVQFEGVILAGRRVQINPGTVVRFLDFDQVAPVLSLLTPEDGAFVTTSRPEIRATVTDDFSGVRLASLELLLDGADRTAEAEVETDGLTVTLRLTPSENLTEGGHELSLSAADHSDNEATAAFSFTVDTVPPALVVVSPAAPRFFNSLPPVVLEYADATSGVDLGSLEVAVDGLDFTPACAVEERGATCPLPDLAEGEHTVTAQVRDRAGNLAAAASTFELIFDTEPPEITVLNPADGATVDSEELVVTGTVTDKTEVVEVRVNGQPAALSGGTFTAPVVLEPGPNTLRVEATDEAGNTGAVTLTVTFVFDTTPPFLAITSPRAGAFVPEGRPAIDVSFSDDESGVDPGSLAFTLDDEPLGVSCEVGALGARCVPAEALPERQVRLGAVLSDLAGNPATASVQFTVDTVGVEIAITDPPDRFVTREGEIPVVGTLGPGIAAVSVNGVPASLSGGGFSALIPLREGTNMVVALATKTNGNTGTATVEVTRDIMAPIVRIDSPRDGFVAVTDRIPVTGLVNDLVSGGAHPRVLVNGVEAAVANGAFLLESLQLVPGPNVLEAVATDEVGNEGRHAITVRFQKPVGARIAIESGNGQSAPVNQTLVQPLGVSVQDDLGNPVAGRVVTFEVTRNSGTLRARLSDEPRRRVQVPTDGSGRAAVFFTLGDTAGEGTNRVRATGLGVAGEVEFCATGLADLPDKILMVRGDNQRGLVSHPLATPLEALVVDRNGNPVAGIGVTFQVVRGTGTLDGQGSMVRITGLDGVARAVLTLGREPGINNNVVRATFPGLEGLPATFTASGLPPGDPAQTRFSGVVLDNAHTPIPGARVHIAGTEIEGVTDGEGQFLLTGVPVGHIVLEIDPAESPRPETFPPLEFETVTVAGQTNTLGQPILLPALDTESSKIVGGSEDVTLTMPGVEGLALTVFAHSVTFPDGSRTGRLTISQVHLDKVPMPPPNGSLFMPPAWTIQPAGVAFDPPARISIPNDGLPPGRVIDIFQFDHTLNEFINVGKGTVSEDAFVITSDPGFGITRSGWGGCSLPPTPVECRGRRCVDPDPTDCIVVSGNRCDTEGCKQSKKKQCARCGPGDMNVCTKDGDCIDFPKVTLTFHNTGSLSDDNSARFPTGDPVVLGLVSEDSRFENRIEIQGTIEPSDFICASYDIKRTKSRVLIENGELRSELPPGTDDDTHNQDEDLRPENDHIYSIDSPGLSRPVAQEGSTVVLKNNFVEFVLCTVNGKTKKCSDDLKWHSIVSIKFENGEWIRNPNGENKTGDGHIEF